MIRYYIDVETTGLDSSLHEIIDLAIIAEEAKTGKVIGEYCRKIKPMNIHSAQLKALEINGYNEDDWKDAVEPSEVIAAEIVNLLEIPGIWIGHNPYFDKRFISNFLSKYGSGLSIPYMPMLDTRQLSIAMFWPELTGFSLGAVRSHMGLGLHGSHVARSDAYICRQIMHRFDVARSKDI